MENCGFGWQNFVLIGSLSASSQHAQLPVTNLKLPQGAASLAWRAIGDTVSLVLRAVGAYRVVSVHRTNLTANAVLRVTLFRGDVAIIEATSDGTAPVNGQCVIVLPRAYSGDQMRLDITDHDNPDGFLSIPLCYAGPLFQPARNYAAASTENVSATALETTTMAGAEFVAPQYVQRRLTIAHQSLGDDDVSALRSLQIAAASGANTLFIPNPGAAPQNVTKAALYGRAVMNEISNPFGAADRHATTIDIKERL
ncbi:F5/8 type C domain-containing protein [Acetobacteraceae bacterium EV16G]|uniref:F5/8 type C domain-containing protein n=1 Tax=Sorlinia euscelidii TaxID=3081148 RepID=A0ABU7U006_9PROT